MTIENVKTKATLIGKALVLTLLLAISCKHEPLYYANQNTYLLHGLADGGLNVQDSYDILSEMGAYSRCVGMAK